MSIFDFLGGLFPGLFEKVVCEHNAAKMKKCGKTDCIKISIFFIYFFRKIWRHFFCHSNIMTSDDKKMQKNANIFHDVYATLKLVTKIISINIY
jgi:hypothetical protein